MTQTTDLDDLLAMDKRELIDEVMRLRAALQKIAAMPNSGMAVAFAKGTLKHAE